MISHEDPNDLIDSVTAEIEAIIQEEIISQNSSSQIEQVAEQVFEKTEAEAAVPTVEVTKTVQEEIFTENLQQAESVETAETDTINTIENIEMPNETLQLAEVVEVATETNSPVETMVEVGNVEYVDYTVKVASPNKEEELTASNEVIENVSPVFTTIESILSDVPIDEKDGPRAKHLKQALRKALNNTAKSCR